MAEAAKKPDANEVYQGLTGTQKCAILMMLIGEDEAAEILNRLGINESVWLQHMRPRRKRLPVAVGSTVRLKEYAAHTGRRWVAGQSQMVC